MILGFIEHDQGKINPQSLEMLTLARDLAESSGADLQTALLGPQSEFEASDLGDYGAGTVHLFQHDILASFAPEAWAASIVQLIEMEQPEAVLAAGTDRGNEIMAHVAARLNQPLAANVTAVSPGAAYEITRVRWGGSLLEEARLSGDPKLLTVAPHSISPTPAADSKAVVLSPFTPKLSEQDLRVRLIKQMRPESGKVTLAGARVVVGGGRGVGSAAGFELLEKLADLLGGAVGGSRVVTNLGWRPHAEQVGQTGTRIAPDLYIACGISGAIQHWVGCKGAKQILAINTDPEAPMVTKADYAVIADLHEVVPALIAEIQRLQT
jgi:electron transfer flavoprotein alpha subunit